MNRTSRELYERAKCSIPGGVNSPVRAFKSVGGNPVFIKSAKGPFIYDEDDNQYIDLINSWGPMILGHAHLTIEEAVRKNLSNSFSFGCPTRKEVEIAELIVDMIPSVEKIRMVNSGTEATMSAIRLARGYTQREKIIKFDGCYHGHGDSFLIASGSGLATLGTPDSPGVTTGTAQDTIVAPYNDFDFVEKLFDQHQNEIAAVIIEPVAGNMGCVLPKDNFLKGLRELCTKNQSILIFDEVMTGFRLSKGGAQQLFGVSPDLTTLGKIIGGGLPVGAYGGKKEIMDYVSPQGPVYQAGTLSGNPLAMAAGYAMLKYLNSHQEIYYHLENNTNKLVKGIQSSLDNLRLNYKINKIGSMFSLFFTDIYVENFDNAKTCDTIKFGKYFQAMLRRGVYLAPSQFESLFISTSINDDIISRIIMAFDESIQEVSEI